MEEGDTEISHISPAHLHMHSLPHYQHPPSSVAIDESTLTRHHLPKLAVYLRGHSSCCALYGLRQIYDDIHPPFQYHTEWFHRPKNLLSSACICPSPTPTIMVMLFNTTCLEHKQHVCSFVGHVSLATTQPCH